MNIASSVGVFLLALLCHGAAAQAGRSGFFSGMAGGDSVIVYQCVVCDPEQTEGIAADYVANETKKPYTKTLKYVLVKETSGFIIRVYSTALSDFPNRKFSGLKIREREYWDFKLRAAAHLSDSQLQPFLLAEKEGREAMEYDYPLTKYTRNQVIFKKGKDFRQVVIDGNTRLLLQGY